MAQCLPCRSGRDPARWEPILKAALKAWSAVREPDADNFVFNSQKSTQLNRDRFSVAR
jgi:hypothetical protein